ncbi:hypothetical protein [Sulfitobacter aestuariivivens]|uniref:Uncharacterized protein n=1 Tax=Sulfitobacter aestuariivivens TaxID=2766981 RepID=A0A927HFD5_9RHOB|nr:hypothetical protein [Sulfitobacter aestuariivivens]MBD3664314.1 hypothetical protein [Sulfitobacter aestuariivivens]
MFQDQDIHTKAETLRKQLQEKLGVRSRDLSQALKRAGRRLPRRVRGEGQALVRAEKLAANPKLARQLNSAEVDRAYATVAAHLKDIDVADARKGKLLSLAAAVAGNLLIVIAGFLVWLWWRGYV